MRARRLIAAACLLFVAAGAWFGLVAARGYTQPLASDSLAIPRMMFDTSLADVAFSYTENGVIVLNSKRLAELDPSLAGFVLNHELAHIALHHRRQMATASESEAQELAADCLASRFGRGFPAQRQAAERFFRSRSTGFDLRRAEAIATCGTE